MVLIAVAGCGRLEFDPIAAQRCDTLTLSPATLQTNAFTRTQFTATGGNPPYAFTASGPGRVDGTTGVYISADRTDPADVVVTDAEGCTARATIETGGDSLWFIGGRISVTVPSDEVYRSFDGINWNRVGTLPTPREEGAVFVYDDRLWSLGGLTSTGDTDEVIASRDGVTWEVVGHLPFSGTNPACALYRDEMWVVGGHGAPGSVWHSADGSTWTRAGSLPIATHGGMMQVIDDRMVHYGGHDDILGVFFAQIYASTDGVTWTQVGTLPYAVELMGMAWLDGVLWMAGGTNDTTIDSVLTSVDGTSWITSGTLPVPRRYGTMAAFKNRVWYIGGEDGGATWSAASPAAWTIESASNLPLQRDYSAVLTFTPH